MKELEKIFFSIIIPTFNSNKTIRKALLSVLAQKKNYEIILIDDCSNDKTIEILKKFKNTFSNIKILRNIKNIGVSLTRNKGLLAAKGQYIIFLDSDDYLFPNVLEKLENFIKANNKPDVIFGRFEKSTFPQNNDLIIKNLNLGVNNSTNFKKLILEKNFPLDECWPYIINRKFLFKNKISFFDVRVSEDQLFVLRLFIKMKSFFIFKESFYFHRNLPGTLSDFMNFNYSKCCLRVIIEYYKLLRFEKSKLNKKLINRYIQSCFSMFIAIFVTLKNQEIISIINIFKKNKIIKFNNFYYKNSKVNFSKYIKKYGYFLGIKKAKDHIINLKNKKIKKFLNKKNKNYFYCYSKFLNASFSIISKDLNYIDGILDENPYLWTKKFKGKEICNPKKVLINSKVKIIINNHRNFTIKKIIYSLKKKNIPKKNILVLDY